MLLSVSSSLARQLLATQPLAPVLVALGGALAFEVAVGLNGRMWLAAASPATAVLVANAITESEFRTPDQVGSCGPRVTARLWHAACGRAWGARACSGGVRRGAGQCGASEVGAGGGPRAGGWLAVQVRSGWLRARGVAPVPRLAGRPAARQ